MPPTTASTAAPPQPQPQPQPQPPTSSSAPRTPAALPDDLPTAAQRLQTLRSEMQAIATKIGELESDAEEHRAVIETLQRAQQHSSPDRRCFRMVGGVLVEKTVAEVTPALQLNLQGLRTVVENLMRQYKAKEEQAQPLQRHVVQLQQQQQPQQQQPTRGLAQAKTTSPRPPPPPPSSSAS